MEVRLDADETLLLDLLNTTPVVGGVPRDDLATPDDGQRWLSAHSQPTGADEWRALREVRSLLQAVVRHDTSPDALAPFMEGVTRRATITDGGVNWTLDLPEGRSAAARAILAWDELRRSSPGRLRPCANEECHLFLIDHSKPNRARWCSMATCGNRMKARRHYHRTRQSP